jgi:hypothetical protein
LDVLDCEGLLLFFNFGLISFLTEE